MCTFLLPEDGATCMKKRCQRCSGLPVVEGFVLKVYEPKLEIKPCFVCVTDIRPELLTLCALTSHIHSLLSGGFGFVVVFSGFDAGNNMTGEEKQDVVVSRSGFLQHGWSPAM